MKFLFLFEDFKTGKFRLEDIEKAWKDEKPVFTSILKDNPNHNIDIPLQIINIDKSNGEIGVMMDNDVYYVDLEDIEKIGE